jgi:hypothetical protein
MQLGIWGQHLVGKPGSSDPYEKFFSSGWGELPGAFHPFRSLQEALIAETNRVVFLQLQ